MMRSTFTLLLLLSLGCSGDPNDVEAPGSGGSSGNATAGADAGGSTASTGGSAAGVANGGSVGTAGSSGAAAVAGAAGSTLGGSAGMPGAAGGGPVTATDLLPLAVGNSWTYSATTLSSGCDMPNQVDVISLEPYEGKMAFQLTDSCFDTGPSWLSVVDGTIQQFADEWRISIGAPVAEGSHWTYNPSVELEWRSAGTVTVEAGTFQNCWTRATVARPTDLERTYCPGVGRVLDVRAGARSELTAYHLEP